VSDEGVVGVLVTVKDSREVSHDVVRYTPQYNGYHNIAHAQF